MQNTQDVQLAANTLYNLLPGYITASPQKAVALILGTGLSQAAESLAAGINGCSVPFSKLPNFPLPSVQSHTGAFVCGIWGDCPVIAMQGRCHLYEGRTPAEVCMGTRVLGALGIGTLIVTNAAGALNPLFASGTLMCMSDIINHTGQSPLTGPNNDKWGDRFPDMSQVFDPDLRKIALACALDMGIRLENGVYIGVHGPEMETPAETRMYRQWGADAIGMSTALEVIAARHMGMRVLGISCLTNKNLPDCMQAAPIEEVLRVAAIAAEKLVLLLPAICKKIASA